MITKIKVLIITSFLGMGSFKQYIFDDYILKERTFGDEKIDSLYNTRYSIIDLNTNTIYEIPLNEEYKVATKLNPKHQKGSWRVEGKKLSGIEEESKVRYQNLDCIRIVRSVNSSTPFGPSSSKEIRYLIDVRNLPGIGKNWKKVRLFMGSVDWEYKPPSFIVYQATDFGEEWVIPIVQTVISYEEIDRSLLDRLLSLPTQEPPEE